MCAYVAAMDNKFVGAPTMPQPRKKSSRARRARIQPQSIPIEADAYYNASQLAARWGVHVITVFIWARDGRIPKPAKLGANVSRWHGAAILAHEQACAR